MKAIYLADSMLTYINTAKSCKIMAYSALQQLLLLRYDVGRTKNDLLSTINKGNYPSTGIHLALKQLLLFKQKHTSGPYLLPTKVSKFGDISNLSRSLKNHYFLKLLLILMEYTETSCLPHSFKVTIPVFGSCRDEC